MSRNTLFGALALALATPLIAAWAGGWATVSVENLPDYIVAGQPTNLTFSVRQHGDNYLSDLSPTIVATSGKDEFVARAVETNRPGFYTVTLRPQQAGDWTITINSGFGKSKLTLMPMAAVANSARPVSFSTEERGHRLFAAKSCVTCHVHARVPGSGYFENVAPDLSERRFPAEYLEQYLANPAMKPATPGKMRMPNPKLTAGEIASLVAFINANQPANRVSAAQ
jgi:cytochrome c553